MSVGKTNAVLKKLRYGFAAVDIAINTSDPVSRCTYPNTITVNGVEVENSCAGFTPASSASGSFAMNSWEDHLILEGIKPMIRNVSTGAWTEADRNAANWSDTTNEYFTEFPFQWLSITNNGTKIRIIFSDKDARPDDTFQCYAHAKGCDSYSNEQIVAACASASRSAIMSSNNNPYFANCFHIGCFGASGASSSGAAIYSKKGATYVCSVSYGNFFKGANARGEDFDCMSFQQWTYLQALFVLLYKSTNSQVAHSHGRSSSSSSAVATNAALSTTDFGMSGVLSGTNKTTRMAFFWIHDLWGNIYQYIGGLWNRMQSSTSTKKLYYWLPRQANSRAFSNGWGAASSNATQVNLGTDTGVTDISTSTSGGYIKKVIGNNLGGFAPLFWPGSSTTYFADRGIVSASTSYARFPYVGGYYNSDTSSGFFSCYVDIRSTISGSYYGSRLAYRGGHWESGGGRTNRCMISF